MGQWLAGAGWVIACGLAAFLATRLASHEPAKTPSAIVEALAEPQPLRLTIHLDDAPLETLAATLSQQTLEVVRLNTPVLKSLQLNPSTLVTLHCDQMNVAAALQQVTSGGKPLPLAIYEEIADEFNGKALAPLDVAQARDIQTRMYDLQPVLMMLARRSSVATGAAPAAGGSPLDWPARISEFDDDGDAIIEIIMLIQEIIAPDSWRENGGLVGSVRNMGSLLVVNQRSETHVRIRQLLEALAAGKFDAIGTIGGAR